MKQYYVGSKPYFEWKYRDSSGNLVAAASTPTCAIYDKNGKLVSATETETTTSSATGVYYYDGLTLATSHIAGEYSAIIKITDGTHITRDDTCVVKFELVKVGL